MYMYMHVRVAPGVLAQDNALRWRTSGPGGRFLDFDGSEGPAAVISTGEPSLRVDQDGRAQRQQALEPAERGVGCVQAAC